MKQKSELWGKGSKNLLLKILVNSNVYSYFTFTGLKNVAFLLF